VCPLASAIAAGNCAVVVPPKSAAATSKILEDAVSQLDNDSYVAIPNVSVEEIQKFASSAFQGVVLPSASQAFVESWGVRIIRPHGGRSFAVVDRSCSNLKYAASRIAQAKFLYGGSSPFSPAFVLVNEWVKPEFMRELFAAISQYFPQDIAVSADEYANISEIQKRLTSGKANYGRVVMSGYSGNKRGDRQEVGPMILEAERTRGSELVSMTTNAPILPVFSVRSLDDAIDLGNTFSNGQSLALYTFSSPVGAAYLGQFVDSKSVFMNEIPLTLTGISYLSELLTSSWSRIP
jgi:aldehyde dehydrogenase (NAD+)